MKIACLIDCLGSGGAQRQLVNLAKLFTDSGHNVDFIVYRAAGFFANRLHSFGVYETYIESKNDIDLILRVRRHLRKTSPDVVISFLETPNFIACVSSMGPHSWKLITNELSAKESSFASKRARFMKRFESMSDAIVCNSHLACGMWKNAFPQYSDKMHVIYNPLVVDSVSPLENPSGRGKLNIVVTASFQYLKNPVELTRAVGLLTKSEREAIRIDWYGCSEVCEGDTRAFDEASAIVRENGLSDCVRLHEAVEDIYPIIAAADVVGLFSTVEGLPNAICEGMHFGKPILMTPVSDFDVLAGQGNGIVCGGFDAPAIAAALRKCLSLTDSDMSRMGNKSSVLAEALFSPNVICAQWNGLINELIGAKK